MMTHDAAVIGVIMMAMGVILLLYFVCDRIKAKQSFALKVLAHLFEAMALAFTAYILFKEGTHYLKYIDLLASIAMFISVIIMLKKKKQKGLAE